MTVVTSSKFEKDMKKVSKSDKKVKSVYQDVVKKLENGIELDSKYKLHKLDGCFKGYHSIHLRPDVVVVMQINVKEKRIEMFRVGSHANIMENRKWSPKLN